MKVVISKDFGFSISREAWLWLLDNRFDPCEEFKFNEYTFSNKYWTDEHQKKVYARDVQDGFKEIYKDSIFNPYENFETYLKYECQYCVDIPRHHPLLIQMAEELGERAAHWRDPESGIRNKGFKIVEIPDGVNYEIEEPEGGTEYVREKSRSWG
jgi:hypothetical protein